MDAAGDALRGAGRRRSSQTTASSALQADGLPAVGITFGATAAGASTMPLDWGALIPLWFMRAPAVVVSPCRALSNDEHVRAGAALARATGDRRVALIASADHGHGHSEDGPYGFAADVGAVRRPHAGARPRATASASSSRPTRSGRSTRSPTASGSS